MSKGKEIFTEPAKEGPMKPGRPCESPDKPINNPPAEQTKNPPKENK